jgi:predicted HD phosphohydrolase
MDCKIAAVFSMYDKLGIENHFWENVTQLQNALPAAIHAEKTGHGDMVVIGAFLPDIGD